MVQREGEFGAIGGQEGLDLGNVEREMIRRVAWGGEQLQGQVATVDDEPFLKKEGGWGQDDRVKNIRLLGLPLF